MADAGLEALLEKVQEFRPHQVLLSGDLSEDASAASYQRLKDYLARVDAPLCALPGNHDDDAVMQGYFPEGPWAGPRVVSAGSWLLVLLRSSRAGRIDGVLDEEDLLFLQALLSRSEHSRNDHPMMLALHHQPVPVGSPWIDRYGLQCAEGILGLVETEQRIRAVVWGHVHQAFQAPLGHAQLLACPSTAVNSLPEMEKFREDPAGPACRWFELHSDGKLKTGLLRS